MKNSKINYFQKSAKLKFITCLMLAVISDMLFFNHQIGWTSGLFVILLCLSYVVHASDNSLTKPVKIILLLIFGQALALIENPNLLSFILVIIGFASLAFLQKPYVKYNAIKFISFILSYISVGWLSIFDDYSLLSKYRKKHKSNDRLIFNILKVWLIPVGLSILFIILFALANPVIGSWINQIDLDYIIQYISLLRILFFITAIILCWSIIRPRQILLFIGSKVNQNRDSRNNILIDPSIILRALVLFNLIFFIQNSLDMIYLWGGIKLPNDISHAEYAQRGAYLLIVTSLLAAILIIISLTSETRSENLSIIRFMVYAWIGQNMILLVSSALRLIFYIEAYNLTGLRIAAIIWMALVTIGLILIVIRIVKNKDNIWLINCNLIVLIAVVYFCSFINFGGIIAEYNTSHSCEVVEEDKYIDFNYIHDVIGVDAIPALIKYHNKVTSSKTECTKISSSKCCYSRHNYFKDNTLISLKDVFMGNQTKWRGWTFRKYRISKYLAEEMDYR